MFESRFIVLALGLSLGGCTLDSNGTGGAVDGAAHEGGSGDVVPTTASDGNGLDGSSGKPQPDGGAPEPGDAAVSDGGSAPDANRTDSGDAAGPGPGDDAGGVDAGLSDAAQDGGVDGSALDAGENDATATDATLVPDAPDVVTPACGLNGRYALRINAQVEWEAKSLFGLVPIIRAGEGELSVTVLVDFEGDGTVVTGDVLPCDATVPGFESTGIAGDEDYSVYFAPEVWESPTMPRTTATVNLGCTIPGCVLEMDPMEVLLGAQTGEPFGPWPEDREDLAYPDDDNDGAAGLGLSVKGPDDEDGQFSYIPVGTSGTRTTNIMLGVRVGVTVSGALDDCDTVSGVEGTFQIDTHVTGCTTDDRLGSPCTSSETKFLDDNLPQWTTRSVVFRGVRVSQQAGCYEARAEFAEP